MELVPDWIKREVTAIVANAFEDAKDGIGDSAELNDLVQRHPDLEAGIVARIDDIALNVNKYINKRSEEDDLSSIYLNPFVTNEVITLCNEITGGAKK